MTKVTTITTLVHDDNPSVKVTITDGAIRSTTTGGGATLMRQVGELLIEAADMVGGGKSYHGWKVGQRFLKGEGYSKQLYEVVERPTDPKVYGYNEEWIPVRYVEPNGTLGRPNSVHPVHSRLRRVS